MDGLPEFAKHGKNSFVIPTANDLLTQESKDKLEAQALLDLLEKRNHSTVLRQAR